ncbi:hypothetical protein HHK36_002161 [Tetracentron sinense]|uniref:C3H1-type domain-containing protein n=1 Tax=Tetracentron sinense TaxID=13715 RepID=A0A834ZXP5_TETSI|nr:hypothetical protein HHK36_002161 [Tetracentron sinense]
MKYSQTDVGGNSFAAKMLYRQKQQFVVIVALPATVLGYYDTGCTILSYVTILVGAISYEGMVNGFNSESKGQWFAIGKSSLGSIDKCMRLLLSLGESGSHFPERPDEPDCQYFLKTGSCKFGPTCKFHHPKERISPLATSTLGPLGLPLRPGQEICTFYSLYGICKFGPTCKFDHPLAGYSYDYSMSLPPLSIPDPPHFSYQRNPPVARSPETSPSKLLRLPDRITKSESAASNKHQNSDSKASEDLPQQTASPTQTSPTSSEPLHD